jgi:hypothetical protein
MIYEREMRYHWKPDSIDPGLCCCMKLRLQINCVPGFFSVNDLGDAECIRVKYRDRNRRITAIHHAESNSSVRQFGDIFKAYWEHDTGNVCDRVQDVACKRFYQHMMAEMNRAEAALS